jgi:membrane protease YdiL (CAAX protease family)
LIVAGLIAIVGMRWSLTVSASADGRVIGLGFGIGLLALAIACGWRPARSAPSSVAMGVTGGAVLIALAAATRAGPLPSLAPPGPLAPWAAITVLVACAEELVLRGVFFDAVERRLGVASAIVITSVAFAVMHVPLYGWHVVPLDLGVGLWLAGLRLASGGVAAPAIAHAIADLATWWL